MNPQEPLGAQPNPNQPIPPQPASPAIDPVPVFQNPLAPEGPAAPVSSPQPLVPEVQPQPIVQQPAQAPVVDPVIQPPQPSNPPMAVQEPVPAPMQPAPPPVAQPTVSHMSDDILAPAPVRLAPVPRADDAHADGAMTSSQSVPFGGAMPASSTGAAMATPTAQTPTKKGSKWKIVLIGLAVLLVLGGGTATALFLAMKPTPQPTPSATQALSPVRDTAEKPLQPFAEKVSTDCYVLQVPTPKEIQVNKDCSLSLVYGEQKISSIFVSPQREFDIVAGEDQPNNAQSSPSTAVRFDSQKYLDSLIAKAVSSDLIVTRETIKVAGLDATKVVGRSASSATPAVAYVFIVLPETDQKFEEKTFIAFIITGAYNDDFSRKGFDQAISTWSWK